VEPRCSTADLKHHEGIGDEHASVGVCNFCMVKHGMCSFNRFEFSLERKGAVCRDKSIETWRKFQFSGA